MSEMTEERLLALISAYGGEPARWPGDERAAALELLKESTTARQAMAREAALERELARDITMPAGPTLRRRIMDIPGDPTSRRNTTPDLFWPFGRLWQPAAGLAAAAALGLVIGVVLPPDGGAVVAGGTEAEIAVIAAAGGKIEEILQ